MGVYLSFDQETSIQSSIETFPPRSKKNKDGSIALPIRKRVIGTHGALSKDPRNDVYTMIYATHPNKVKMLHKKKGFKRKLPSESADY